MHKRSLLTLWRLRTAAVNEAKEALATSVAAEQAAAAEEAEATTEIQIQLAAVAAVEADDAAVDAFGAWLPQARLRQIAARDKRVAAEAATARARATLSAARVAEMTIESLIDRKEYEARIETERRAHSELGEGLAARRQATND